MKGWAHLAQDGSCSGGEELCRRAVVPENFVLFGKRGTRMFARTEMNYQGSPYVNDGIGRVLRSNLRERRYGFNWSAHQTSLVALNPILPSSFKPHLFTSCPRITLLTRLTSIFFFPFW